MGMHALPLIRTTTNSFLCGSLKNSSKSLVRRVINTTSNKQQHKQSRINTTATAAMEKHDFDYDIFVIGGGSGGVRASLYNGVPDVATEALVDFMHAFRREYA